MTDGRGNYELIQQDEAVQFTSDLIRLDTSNYGAGEANERPAAEFVAEKLSDAGIDATILEAAPGRSNVIARITGTDSSLPAMLVHGHLDVVPAQAENWSVHPFSGEVSDGVVWGRGAVDMKDMDAMVLAVVRAWAREGRRPVRDMVLAFTADEEDTMDFGSTWLVDKHRDLFADCTEGISEIGAHRVNVAPGKHIYPVGAGERGLGWIRLEARGREGHGALQHGDNAVGRLAAAVARIDAYEWPLRISPTVRASIEALAELMEADIDPDDPALNPEILEATLGASASIVSSGLRNSANPTMLSAGFQTNIIPGVAVGFVDGRFLPGQEAEFQATMDELVGPEVKWEFTVHQPALEAPVEGTTFAAMRDALLAEDSEALVVPNLIAGGTDSKQFSRLGIANYGFAPLGLPDGYGFEQMFHGIDERVPVDGLHFGVRVLDRFLSSVR
ncbi:acetylornithine deacetylase/succinyl-diaminopimelate desuccinylase-like protein [Nocardioides sp. J9]|uniref:M20/M25/M40 family metallo-hydrolase n=1 Tax=Nocardioides sp. J9 TaxID=935844 RepID=UPI00119F27BE|nr:M20/M25/M40 family metallo-hydrolase [Nocardioides sp. J9]TWH01756.1 acetylornithine deacetylase/succinyl-diaminopimelate desuccinylase-like protein [Nocardioides sp. J9]